MEPILNVATFLSGFLNWIFPLSGVKQCSRSFRKGFGYGTTCFFLTKVTGDGLLVLWDTRSMSQMSQHNMISSCIDILLKYKDEFLPDMQRKVIERRPSSAVA